MLPTYIFGDSDRLEQVAINIIENSIINSYDGSKVIVYVNFDKENSKIVFIVKNTGIGINKDDQQQIFQMLRPQPSKDLLPQQQYNNIHLCDGNQMGLGLYIAKQIVMNFDGNIDFYSKELQGSTFVFSFKVEIGDIDIEQIEIARVLEASNSRSSIFKSIINDKNA